MAERQRWRKTIKQPFRQFGADLKKHGRSFVAAVALFLGGYALCRVQSCCSGCGGHDGHTPSTLEQKISGGIRGDSYNLRVTGDPDGTPYDVPIHFPHEPLKNQYGTVELEEDKEYTVTPNDPGERIDTPNVTIAHLQLKERKNYYTPLPDPPSGITLLPSRPLTIHFPIYGGNEIEQVDTLEVRIRAPQPDAGPAEDRDAGVPSPTDTGTPPYQRDGGISDADDDEDYEADDAGVSDARADAPRPRRDGGRPRDAGTLPEKEDGGTLYQPDAGAHGRTDAGGARTDAGRDAETTSPYTRETSILFSGECPVTIHDERASRYLQEHIESLLGPYYEKVADAKEIFIPVGGKLVLKTQHTGAGFTIDQEGLTLYNADNSERVLPTQHNLGYARLVSNASTIVQKALDDYMRDLWNNCTITYTTIFAHLPPTED